jgi:hypothetical protein
MPTLAATLMQASSVMFQVVVPAVAVIQISTPAAALL